MSLPDINLDRRTFQDIVDDVKRQIGRRCPEWTDHNVSDPGVTLIELFAQMTEMMLFQLNQVPEKNYIKFLEMIGISLKPPRPARTDLRFRLSRPIEDADEAEPLVLPARETTAATVRTETQEAVEFSTERELTMVRPRLAHVLAVPVAAGRREEETRDFQKWFNDFEKRLAQVPGPQQQAWEHNEPKFPVFYPGKNAIRGGDALCLGFEKDVSGNLIQLEVRCLLGAATQLNPEFPLQQWECWNATEGEWRRLEPVLDTTYGLSNNPGNQRPVQERGLVELALPTGMTAREIRGIQAYWVRCVYCPERMTQAPAGVPVKEYDASPEIRSLRARVVGGTVSASNCVNVGFKELGQSDGTAGQIFSLGHAPILTLEKVETVLVGEQGTPPSDLEVWNPVPDFSWSKKNDRHFVLDSMTGEVRFGPSIANPDGSPPCQYGAVPKKGLTISLSGYRFGGGTRGNVAAGQISILKSSFPYIVGVINPEAAIGGREMEALDGAKIRGQRLLRMRDRAVTPEDFEFHAGEVSGVGRARCVRTASLHQPDVGAPPGVVRLLIVPMLGDGVTVPRPADLRVPDRVLRDVREALDERRLLTTVLEVGEPDYVYISTDITLVASPNADPEVVRQAVKRRLERYIHPLTGGPNGSGWPFSRKLNLADVYAQVQAASGVAFLRDARLHRSILEKRSAPANRQDQRMGPETDVSNREGVSLGPDQVLASREHRIRVVPMESVGEEDGGASRDQHGD